MLCSITTFSQDIKYGVKGGLNLSNLKGDYPNLSDEDVKLDTKSSIGFHIGGFLEYKINDKFSIQPELLISMQGNKLELTSEFYDSFYDENYKETFTQTPKLYYLNIPLMLKYKLIDKLSIEFGPQIGILLSAKSKWEYKDHNDPSENGSINVDLLNDGTYNFLGENIQVKKGMKRFDFGLNIGASYDITEKFFLQGRYNLGLATIDENSTVGDEYKSWNLKNSVFQLSAGYRF